MKTSTALTLALAFCAATAITHPASAADTSAATGTSRDADNSKVNQRDQSPHEVTAGQQSSGTRDMEITRQIRQAIVKQEGLSTYADNVKIVTINGVVTLKGPVESAAEKMKAEQLAKTVAGVTKVDNQISINQ